jgi:hypothetical protein
LTAAAWLRVERNHTLLAYNLKSDEDDSCRNTGVSRVLGTVCLLFGRIWQQWSSDGRGLEFVGLMF